MRKVTALSWSGGKDSLMSLLALERDPEVEIAALLTTLNEEHGRIAMHGVPEALLEQQARALGLTLVTVGLPSDCDNETYLARTDSALAALAREGVTGVAFGDLFLEDVRTFRERQVRSLGLEALFPIWATPTEVLARSFIDSGHRAVLTCVDTEQLDARFLGREFNDDFLAELPVTADPCGERGEFHSFVHAGPRLATPLKFRTGRRVTSAGRFQYLDLVTKPTSSVHV